MNKVFARITAALGFLALAGTAAATPIPFQITGSDLNVVFEEGGAIGQYLDESMDIPEYLDEGESFNFNFGTVWSAALGSGIAELVVNLATPTPEGVVSDQGDFSIFSVFIFTLADLDWGAPVQFGYTYGGLGGGILALNLWDFEGVTGGGLELNGTITNVKSPDTPVPVPEPGILLLLGSGLLATAGMRLRTAART
jgi:hypothetical protein